jgi:hypothetical protein
VLKGISLVAGLGIFVAVGNVDTHAMAFAPTQRAWLSDVTKVAGGCGWGWHRGPEPAAAVGAADVPPGGFAAEPAT